MLYYTKKFKTPIQKMKEAAVFWSSNVTINPKIQFFQLLQIHFKNQQFHAVAIKILRKERKKIYIYKYIYITYSYETMPEDGKIMIN